MFLEPSNSNTVVFSQHTSNCNESFRHWPSNITKIYASAGKKCRTESSIANTGKGHSSSPKSPFKRRASMSMASPKCGTTVASRRRSSLSAMAQNRTETQIMGETAFGGEQNHFEGEQSPRSVISDDSKMMGASAAMKTPFRKRCSLSTIEAFSPAQNNENYLFGHKNKNKYASCRTTRTPKTSRRCSLSAIETKSKDCTLFDTETPRASGARRLSLSGFKQTVDEPKARHVLHSHDEETRGKSHTTLRNKSMTAQNSSRSFESASPRKRLQPPRSASAKLTREIGPGKKQAQFNFSSTVLAQMLAKEGMLPEKDFEVHHRASPKNSACLDMGNVEKTGDLFAPKLLKNDLKEAQNYQFHESDFDLFGNGVTREKECAVKEAQNLERFARGAVVTPYDSSHRPIHAKQYPQKSLSESNFDRALHDFESPVKPRRRSQGRLPSRRFVNRSSSMPDVTHAT